MLFSGAPGWLSRLSTQPLTTAQVMVSWFVGSCPAIGLHPDSTEPMGFSLPLCPSPARVCECVRARSLALCQDN